MMRKFLRHMKYCDKQEGQQILVERMSYLWQSGQKLLFLSQREMHCGWYVCLQNNSALDSSQRQMLQVLSPWIILPFPLPFLHHFNSAGSVVKYCCSFSHSMVKLSYISCITLFWQSDFNNLRIIPQKQTKIASAMTAMTENTMMLVRLKGKETVSLVWQVLRVLVFGAERASLAWLGQHLVIQDVQFAKARSLGVLQQRNDQLPGLLLTKNEHPV